ncbi:MAG: ABC transporter substrate-binding protein [Pleurocapsa sp.]
MFKLRHLLIIGISTLILIVACDRPPDSLKSDRLTLLKPDLILGEEWNNKDEYSLLTQIAPTLLFSDLKNPDEVQSWQQDIDGIAKALGKQDQKLTHIIYKIQNYSV